MRARWLTAVLACAAICALYFFGLARTGMLSTDEPRYAAVGRAMAQSGDWVTPRLWGAAWFEKPALLYWMTGLGFKLGLDEDLAPRLPVAIVSVAFLGFFWWLLRRDAGERVAWCAAAILATSAGWLAYSHVAVTDLPLSVCFAAAMLLIMPDRTTAWSEWMAAGILLGLAVLAKGLVPLVLFIPALWFRRREWRRLVLLLAIAMVVATPWYGFVIYRNGAGFVNEFFLKQHFARFTSPTLQHIRPVWFYIPVLLGAVFPWTPALAALFRRSLYANRREQFLLTWVLVGLVFFSVSRNKLPGYVLPLLPALAALLGIALTRFEIAQWILPLCGAFIWLVPGFADVLPQALLSGLSHALLRPDYRLIVPMLMFAAGLRWLASHGQHDLAIAAIVLGMTAAAVHVVWYTYPILDRTVSPRAYWRIRVENGHASQICTHPNNRSWQYGLNYYAGKTLPNCNF